MPAVLEPLPYNMFKNFELVLSDDINLPTKCENMSKGCSGIRT